MTETTSAATRKGTAPTAKRKPRGEYAKSAATRTAILDAALEVFAESGYRAGSLREVAERVGMSEAGLLHHFRSKSALLLAVLDHRDALARELVDFELPDGVEALRGLVALARHNALIPGVVELYCTLSAEATSPTHPAHAYFVNRYESVRASVTASFQRVADSGRLMPGVDPGRAAVATIALMDGLQVQWLLDAESTDMAEALAEAFRAMVSGFDLAGIEQVLDARSADAASVTAADNTAEIPDASAGETA
ncbi:TetR/AcrR family transcriptional regulator [Microbacterium sp. HD4P20]|uniref:TetR/AcrR family transcriptional regulator n=1 Tax=Microbacterium sp. HD4P20 TaxID=2864874 RepID=UPI001C641F07|nr:TetR/AcrR family transcriptional regulator [Microbacterium sp. HD4P20]MCP2635195.1 TetR/AcrR family transcriptional regulator [Microbacterium sp. HD4P20]